MPCYANPLCRLRCWVSLALLALTIWRGQLFVGDSFDLCKDQRQTCRLRRRGQPSDDASTWSVRDLKQFLDECGLRHSDCFEKKELVDRVQAALDAKSKQTGESKARGTSDEELSAMSARELKAKIVEVGGSVAGCALKFGRESSWTGRKHEALKYSSQTIKLCKQHVLEKHGRWGDQSQPKGFDRHILEDVLNQPFLPDPRDLNEE
eukprot:s378_g4.t2